MLKYFGKIVIEQFNVFKYFMKIIFLMLEKYFLFYVLKQVIFFYSEKYLYTSL